jgi:hypothetical protein
MGRPRGVASSTDVRLLQWGMPPNSAPEAVAALVEGIVAVDALESAHRAQTLEWLASTSDVYRQVKPRTPDKHLVVYFIPIDRARERILLVATAWPACGCRRVDTSNRLSIHRRPCDVRPGRSWGSAAPSRSRRFRHF